MEVTWRPVPFPTRRDTLACSSLASIAVMSSLRRSTLGFLKSSFYLTSYHPSSREPRQEQKAGAWSSSHVGKQRCRYWAGPSYVISKYELAMTTTTSCTPRLPTSQSEGGSSSVEASSSQSTLVCVKLTKACQGSNLSHS